MFGIYLEVVGRLGNVGNVCRVVGAKVALGLVLLLPRGDHLQSLIEPIHSLIDLFVGGLIERWEVEPGGSGTDTGDRWVTVDEGCVLSCGVSRSVFVTRRVLTRAWVGAGSAWVRNIRRAAYSSNKLDGKEL